MKAIITVILFVSISTINAQVTQEWVSRYNGPGNSNDITRSLAVDDSGNVYVTGFSYGTYYSDYATIKYDAEGVEQWVARYNGPGNSNDDAFSIAVDGSGNVYVTGYSMGSGTSGDYATIKYNSAGDSVWVRRYNGPGNDWDDGTSITVDTSGNVYVTGRSWGGSGTSQDYATIKYNSAGVQQWVARYDGPANSWDYAFSIAVDDSGNVYVTGESMDSGMINHYATIKYNSSGVQQWVQRYNGPGNGEDEGYSIAVDGSGNVYVTGYSMGSGTGADYATIKYNSAGDSVWVRRYNGPGNDADAAFSLAVDGLGNVYVTGSSNGSGTSLDYATIKYNSAGAEQWVARYNGPAGGVGGADQSRSITIDVSGNVYVTGNSDGDLGGMVANPDYCTIKYNSSGVQRWVQRYNGPGNDIDVGTSIAVDNSGNVYVTGYSQGTGADYATIKYSQTAVPDIGCMPNPLAVNTASALLGTFYCKNDGDTVLEVTDMTYAATWIDSVSPDSFNVAKDDSVAVTVYFDTTGITPGIYYDTLLIASNDPDEDPYKEAIELTVYDQTVGEGAENKIIPVAPTVNVFPNPAKNGTSVRFSLSRTAAITVDLYDALGRKVSNLVSGTFKDGIHDIVWNMKNEKGITIPQGIYFIQLKTDKIEAQEKLIITN